MARRKIIEVTTDAVIAFMVANKIKSLSFDQAENKIKIKRINETEWEESEVDVFKSKYDALYKRAVEVAKERLEQARREVALLTGTVL